MSEILDLSLAFLEALTAKDGLGLVDDTVGVASAGSGKRSWTIRTVIFGAETDVLAVDEGKSTEQCGEMC